MFSLNCLYRTECNFMILEKVQSLSQEALDYSRRKSFDRIPNSLSRHPSLILSTSQTNRNYIIPRPRHEFERTDSSLRSPYLYGSQQRGNSFSSNSPKNTPTQEINPYSLNYNSASLTHRTPLSTEHLLGTEFDLSNPPFDIDVPKKVSIEN